MAELNGAFDVPNRSRRLSATAASMKSPLCTSAENAMPLRSHSARHTRNVRSSAGTIVSSSSWAVTATRLGRRLPPHEWVTNAAMSAPSPAPASSRRTSAGRVSKSEAMKAPMGSGVRNCPNFCFLSASECAGGLKHGGPRTEFRVGPNVCISERSLIPAGLATQGALCGLA